MTEFVNTLSSIGTILLFVFSIVAVLLLVTKKQHWVLSLISKNAILLSLLIGGLGVIGSLTYSNIIGYQPCNLCWWQRIFIYPSAILFLIAYTKKDSTVFRYTNPLLLVGLLFSLYHNYIYYTGYSPLPCGTGVSCTQRFVFEFGFVTIPLMALSIFISLLSISLITKKFSTTTA